MTPEDRKNFDSLTKDRSESADTFDKPSMRGARDNVVDKYSDQAHFIYELLQNADDVGAKEAFFELRNKELIFSHNGSKHFSVSNPFTEDEDKKNNLLGDINAICSVGQSNKGNDATIGKFGVGFKAVFQYTATPRIYDKNFQFKIERLFVPKLIEDDNNIHKDKKYTYFVFPFDKEGVTPEYAFTDISEKLESLTYPLLFLNNLTAIMCEYAGNQVIYDKTIEKRVIFGDAVAEKVVMTVTSGSKTAKTTMWLFSRKFREVMKYSVGYILDENGAIKPVERGAFCYFPTKEYTGLKFIVHAPFLLTSSRETVKANEEHNIEMVDLLSDLGRDSILFLRDIGIKERKQLVNDDFFLNIIPKPKKQVYWWQSDSESEKDKLSFEPFAEKIREMLSEEEIFPCSDGMSYVSAENAYWVRTPKMAETFDDEKLVVLTGNENAKWIFQPKNNFNDQQNTNREFYDYINDIIGREHRFEDADILRNNSNLVKLITLKNVSWLHKLYSYGNQTKENKDNSKVAPIFLDECGDPTPIFERKGNTYTEVLFLPSEIKTLKAIHPAILNNPDSKKFITDLGITEPSKVDQIKDGILKKYAEDESYGELEDFEKIFKVYNNVEIEEQVSLLKAIESSNYRIAAKDVADEYCLHVLPKKTYFRTEQLEKFFSYSDDYIFVDDQLLGGKRREKEAFIEKMGAKYHPAIITRTYRNVNSVREINKKWGNHRDNLWEENYIDGEEENLELIIKNKDKERSVLLWNVLLDTIKRKNGAPLESVLTGSYYWRSYGSWKFDCNFLSRGLTKLINSPWISLKDGSFIAPSKTTLDLVADNYDLSSFESKILVKSLRIGDARFNAKEMDQMRFAEEMEKTGIPRNEILEILQREAARRAAVNSSTDNDTNEPVDEQPTYTETDEQMPRNNEFGGNTNNSNDVTITGVDPGRKDIYEQIEKERKRLDEDKPGKAGLNTIADAGDETEFEDEVFQPSENTAKKIEKKQQEIAKEVKRIEREQMLTDNIAHSKKYSYGWITNLIDKELLLTEQFEGKSKGIKATFLAVEKEEGSNRTLVLKNPVGGIPQDIENHNDIPMTFVFDNGDTKDVIVDAFNINSYTVRAKLKNVDQVSGIILSDVREINIKLEKAGFLLEELCARYKDFKYDNAYSMLDNLTSRIDFVFGPPGTGKTTYLCKDVIIPIMNECNDKKILVLGPTNKSADVIVNKIIELSGDDQTYEDWLVRFGSTNDESIDVLPIYKDKHVDLDEYGDCTVVTTIHRFWYDFFIPKFGEGLPLREVDWDYIIIDEASMIPLVHILYPLFRKSPEKFIIAGDPFQIEPVITAEEWKDENIYTMVNLNEFKEHPNTRPHKYDVKLLTTQYRSIPCIGRVFSNLTYDGVLKHHRSEMDRKKIDFGGEKYSNISLIRYPVSKYESIYASKRLGVSAYHVYSALLAYEFAAHLAKKIENGDNDHVSIGIISPYRAQADIIEKMCRNIPKSSNASIQVGTIHGFQGDECDIVICVFNAPPGELTSSRISINKQNIINVAISRARDYLFIVAPEEGSRGFENLFTLNKLIGIARSESAHSEKVSAVLEKNMFEDDKYLEKNTFSTAHQSVNVYERPEKKYEIRAEDNALDIQVHINATAITPKEEQSIQQNTLVEDKGVETEPMEKEEVKPEKPAREYNSENYYMQLYLKKDVDAVFKDRKFDVIPDKGNALAVKYTNKKYSLSGMELFRLENKTKDKRVIIYAKAGVLDAINLGERFVFNFTKSKKEFWFAVDYDKLPGVLESFAEFEKKSQISDEELVLKLHAIRND